MPRFAAAQQVPAPAPETQVQVPAPVPETEIPAPAPEASRPPSPPPIVPRVSPYLPPPPPGYRPYRSPYGSLYLPPEAFARPARRPGTFERRGFSFGAFLGAGVTVHGGVPDFGPALGVRMGTTIEEAVTIFAAAQGASVQSASGETASTVLLSLGAQYFADRIALRAEIGAAAYEGPDARGSPTDATTGLPRGIGFVVGVGYELLRVRTSVFAIEASFIETFSQELSVSTIVLAVAYQLY